MSRSVANRYLTMRPLPNLALWDQGARRRRRRAGHLASASRLRAHLARHGGLPLRSAHRPGGAPAEAVDRCSRRQRRAGTPKSTSASSLRHSCHRCRRRTNGCYAEPSPRCQIVTTAVTSRQGGKACLDPTRRPRGWLRIGEMEEEWASARPSPGRQTSGRGENTREASSPIRAGQRPQAAIITRSVKPRNQKINM